MPNTMDDVVTDECVDIKENIKLIFSKLSRLTTYMDYNFTVINKNFTILENRLSSISDIITSGEYTKRTSTEYNKCYECSIIADDFISMEQKFESIKDKR